MKLLAGAVAGGDVKKDCKKKMEATIEMTGDLQKSPKSSNYCNCPKKEEEVSNYNPALEMEYRCPILLGLFVILLVTFLPSPSYQSLALYCLFVVVLGRLGSAEHRYNKYLLRNKANKKQSTENE